MQIVLSWHGLRSWWASFYTVGGAWVFDLGPVSGVVKFGTVTS